MVGAQKGKESCKEVFHLRKYINHHVQNVDRNADNRGHSDEVCDGGEELVGQWRKGHPCSNMVRNAAELCLRTSVLWQVELPGLKLDAFKIIYLFI